MTLLDHEITPEEQAMLDMMVVYKAESGAAMNTITDSYLDSVKEKRD